jgi:hypothetical protein
MSSPRALPIAYASVRWRAPEYCKTQPTHIAAWCSRRCWRWCSRSIFLRIVRAVRRHATVFKIFFFELSSNQATRCCIWLADFIQQIRMYVDANCFYFSWSWGLWLDLHVTKYWLPISFFFSAPCEGLHVRGSFPWGSSWSVRFTYTWDLIRDAVLLHETEYPGTDHNFDSDRYRRGYVLTRPLEKSRRLNIFSWSVPYLTNPQIDVVDDSF